MYIVLFWPLFRQIVFPQKLHLLLPPSNIDWTLIEITFWSIGIYSRDPLEVSTENLILVELISWQKKQYGKICEEENYQFAIELNNPGTLIILHSSNSNIEEAQEM